MNDRTDRAGVVFPPPLVMLIALLAALGLQQLWPLSVPGRPFAMAIGAVLSLLGVGIGISGRLALKRAGTNVNPYKASSAIVRDGSYRFSRNPLYLGMCLLLVGLTLLAGTWWGIPLLVPAFLVLHYGVVLREEAYLERKFGPAYLDYKNSVRRWI